MAASIERGGGHRRESLRSAQTCERSWRVIWSIAVRPRWTVSTRAPTSPERFITTSISENVASETIIAITIVTSSSGSVKPSWERRRLMSSHSAWSCVQPVAEDADDGGISRVVARSGSVLS